MCVFAPPERELLGLDFEAARRIVHRRRAAEPGRSHAVLPHQSINIAGKIAEVDRALRAEPRSGRWLVEVHPELSFRLLAGRRLPAKRTAEGSALRYAGADDRPVELGDGERDEHGLPMRIVA
jgi:predicted RNase H-like nuclease